MRKLLSLLCIFSIGQVAQGSVFGEHSRGAAVMEKYPQTLSVSRFAGARVDDMDCDWKNAGRMDVNTDRGNYSFRSFIIAPSAIKVLCEGKRPFYIFALPPRYLGANARNGDVGVWFGDKKDRYGCEGYTGCDKVHIIQTYHNKKTVDNEQPELQEW